MKKIIPIFVVFFALFFFVACPNPLGLHNQQAAQVVFVFQNFPEDVDGDYAIPGHFTGSGNAWEVGIDTTMIKMTKGNGESDPITCSNANIQFSLVKTGDAAWNRGWYKAGVLEGNGADKGKYYNFYIDGINLAAGEIRILVDGSISPVVPVEE